MQLTAVLNISEMSVASFVSETDIQKKRNNNWTVLLNFGVGSRLLTEGSCVCGLGEILWHFPVDIKSVKIKEEKVKKTALKK